jgi:hypothetical protein
VSGGKVEIKWQGVTSLGGPLLKELNERQQKIARAVKRGAMAVQATARGMILRDEHTGRVYGNHTASDVGQSPANDTGNLARNIAVLADNEEGVAYVISRAPYSAALEFGSVRMQGTTAVTTAPRPFMQPALDANIEKITEDIAKALSGKTKDGS